jgi:ribosomal-protein-serine acetyltransferase
VQPAETGGHGVTFRREVEPGLELRQFTMADAAGLYVVVNQNRAYLRQWLPWVDRTQSVDDIRDFIAARAEQFECSQGPNAAIWLRGRIIGTVGCHPIDWSNWHCSIGYWLEAGCQGKGIMTRCCTSLLDYLFQDTGLHRVTIQCGTENHKSCAIPQRLGFTREGVLRQAEWVNDRWLDLIAWSMLDREWAARGADSRDHG